MFKIYFAGVIVALSISGCSESSIPEEGADTATASQNIEREPVTTANLYGHEWQWLEGKRSSIGTLPFIQLIQIDEGGKLSIRLVGYSGCNRLHGTASTTAQQTLQFSHIAMTKRACEKPEIMLQESKLMDALQQTTQYGIQGNRLKLINSDDQSLLIFTAKPSA